MDFGRIIQMVVNLLLRRAVNKGVNMGIEYASSLGKKPAPQTEADLQQANDTRAMAKRARQAAKITRRL